MSPFLRVPTGRDWSWYSTAEACLACRNASNAELRTWDYHEKPWPINHLGRTLESKFWVAQYHLCCWSSPFFWNGRHFPRLVQILCTDSFHFTATQANIPALRGWQDHVRPTRFNVFQRVKLVRPSNIIKVKINFLVISIWIILILVAFCRSSLHIHTHRLEWLVFTQFVAQTLPTMVPTPRKPISKPPTNGAVHQPQTSGWWRRSSSQGPECVVCQLIRTCGNWENQLLILGVPDGTGVLHLIWDSVFLKPPSHWTCFFPQSFQFSSWDNGTLQSTS